ncbi:hypothetical protein GCM10007973_27230 [Polymorphobacter multimanifer]|uniref:sigma 54-interacting transcriptional regulator n=1 Tax=Polymorphobacter multimanifer TaxID=1070431 RepID=UPI001664BD1C|nr:sigma 54-interacting transcriptional regulator [Polymorphobacter multimanifer]GGI89409.1 hypothetical protein GCM10007973_27230 [Polymorphobacter multimanifer]
MINAPPPPPVFWPALPALLATLPPFTIPVVWTGERPSCPHVYIGAAPRLPARRSAATLGPHGLALHLAPGDEGHALALIAAFLAPETTPAATAPASRALLALAARVAPRDVSVLIEGATGTGKEGLARLIHQLSPRRDASLVAVNCAALPEAMLEATLFGHERGAFTGAVAAGRGLFREADGGTLFLDEVAELPLPLQAKLLRALQEREVMPVGATRPVKVDVRLIAAGNRDLAADVACGRFRADLYYRLAVFPLRTLPLAERIEDLPAIAAALLLRRAREARHGTATVPTGWLPPSTGAALLAHPWPGNVRERGNVLDRALVMAAGTTIDTHDLTFDTPFQPRNALPRPLQHPPHNPALTGAVRAQEERSIACALAEAPPRRAAAARLGISERTLRYKMAGIASRSPGFPREMRLQ